LSLKEEAARQNTQRGYSVKEVAEGDFFKGELSSGSEDGCKCKKYGFEHPDMLYSGPRNCNDTKADGIFGRHNDVLRRLR